MADIVLGMDVSQTTTAARQFVAALRAMNDVAIELGSSLASFNAKGEATRTVLEGFTPIGQKVKSTFAEVDGVMTHLSSTIEGAAAAQRRFTESQIQMAAALERTAAAARAEGIVRAGIGGGVEGASIAQINTVERAIARIRETIESGKASEQDFQSVLAATSATGVTGFDNMTAGAQRLALEINNIIKVQQEVSTATKKAADDAKKAAEDARQATLDRIVSLKQEAEASRAAADAARAARVRTAQGAVAESTLRGTFGLPEGADAASVARFETLINRIKTAVTSGAVSISEFNRILQTIRADPTAALSGLSPAAQRVSNDIRALTQDVKTVGEEGKKAGEKILISWQGVVRIFETQVIRQGIRAIINEFRVAVEAATEFSIEVGRVRAVSQQLGLTEDEVADKVRQLSGEFGRPEIEVAKAAYLALNSQVVKGKEAFDLLNQSMKLSAVTGITANESTQAIVNTMKSFSLGAADAEHVAATLFKTIQLSGVPANEIVNAFGKIGIQAKALGISFDQVAAATATLTSKGVRLNDATSLLSNLFNKLLDPSKEATKIFEQFGVTSGQALLSAVGGFREYLKLLDSEGGKGTERLADLVGGAKALRAAIGLTGPAFDDFDAKLKALANTEEEFNKKTKTVTDTFGSRFKAELTKARNFFEKEFGEPFEKALVNVIETLGGVEKIIKTVVDVVKIGVEVFVLYKASVIAAGVANLGFVGTLSALKIDAVAAFGAIRNIATAYGAVVAAQGLFQRQGPAFEFGTKIGEAIFGKIEQSQAVYEQALADITKRNEQFAKDNAGTLKEREEAEKKFSSALSTEIDKRFAGLINNSANVIKLSAEVRDAQIRHMKEIQNQVKITGDTYESSIRNKIQKMTEDIRRSVEDVRKSQKAVIEAPDKAAGKVFDFKYQYADDRQQLDLIDQRINTLRKRGTELFREGTREGVEEARKLFDQIEELETRRQAKFAEIQKRRFEATGQGPTFLTTDIATQQQRLELIINTAEQESRIKAIAAERIKLEQDFQKQAAAFQAKKEKEKEDEKTRLDTIQKAIKAAAEFTVLDEKGRIRTKFTEGPTGPDPARAAQRAAEEFQKIIDVINDKATAQEKTQFGFFIELQKQKQAIVTEVQTVIRTEEAKTTQQAILNDKEKLKSTQARVEAEKKAAKEKIPDLQKTIEAELEMLRKAAEQGNIQTRRLGVGPIELGKFLFTGEVPSGAKERAQLEQSAAAREKAIEAIQEAQKAGVALAEAPSKALARAFEDAVTKAKEAFAEFSRLRTGLDFPQGGIGFSGRVTTVKDDLQKMRDNVSELVDQFTIIDKSNARLESALSILKRMAQDDVVVNQFKAAGESAQSAGKIMTGAFVGATETIDQLAAKVNNLREQFEKFKGEIPKPATIPGVKTESFGGLISYFSGGGFVARGRDRIPAMLAAGEMVMTPEATSRWYPVLSAMNARQPVRYFSQGGPVTNVGDINITVRGGATSNETLQEVAQGLRRGLRRGTITLGD